MLKQGSLISINLSFFADSSQEKTEPASPKKKKKAREEGQVAKSQEISTAVGLIVAFFSIGLFATYIMSGISDVFIMSFDIIRRYENINDIHFSTDLINFMFGRIIFIAAPLLIISLIVGIFVNIVQVGWSPTLKPLKPKFSKVSPLAGFKRMFSMRSIMELVKSVLKLSIISFVIYFFLIDEMDNVAMIMQMSVINSFMYIGALVIRLGVTVGAWFIFIAAIDFSFQKHKHSKDLRMSKQEVKDEYKQSEGNPQIKSRIRRKMQEASMRRMMQDIPKADVIITNPTHYSVAVAYDRSGAGAPKVVAKGVDHLAKRIQEVAKENNISIIENVQLARALYAAVDIGKEIPQELYKAVAEVLAYVYKLKNTR